ncbi:MAG: hypothetical protein JXR23_06950 [Pontiellaceae bacterium]|nr:hypothetical protein [Pontiellaceae bacterium]
MKRTLLTMLSVALLAGCGQKTQPKSSSAAPAVQESFAALKTALRDGNGPGAASRVTPQTLEMYERCRKLALDSAGTDFESLSQLEVLLTFQLRWLLPKAELETMDGTEVFAWGVEEGLVKKDTLAAIELDKVQPEGGKAVATLRNQGQPVTDLVFDFELHDGVWQLDFKRILQSTDRAFAALRERAGKTKIELAVYLIEQTYESEVPSQILNGPLK